MELDIQDGLQEYFRNIGIEVGYVDVRLYHIRVVIETCIYTLKFKYDANLTFDANIDIIIKEIEKCILEYYKRK